MLLGLVMFVLGIYGAYLKLFDKSSWLYKESEGTDWLYDSSNVNIWALILNLIVGGGGIFYYFLGEVKKLFD